MRHTKARKTATPRARVGRPPAGDGGQKVSDYTQITMRLPDPTKALLDAISGMTGMPAWRVFEQALASYVQALSPEEQRVLSLVQQRRARGH